MQNQYRLAERAVLMQLSVGMPGKHRKDRVLSDKVKGDNHLGAKSGAWVKNKYPDWALQDVEKLVNEARAYHAAVTLPYTAGVGILPGALIMEYGDRMRTFSQRYAGLRDAFKARYPEMIEWAKVEHNGTFEADDYPDIEEVVKAFYFRIEPVPVPDAGHYEDTIKGLLGVDADGINVRVQDAMTEGQRELMSRMTQPIAHMAYSLAREKCLCSKCKGKVEKKKDDFKDSLLENIRDIVKLAPKLNIAGDPSIDRFVKDMEGLTRYTPKVLRESEADRTIAANAAKDVLAKLEGYKI